MRNFISLNPCQPANVLTFGHGRLLHPELAALLTDAGVEWVIDVHRFPGSHANPVAVEHPISDGARLEDSARENGVPRTSALEGGARLLGDGTPDAE